MQLFGRFLIEAHPKSLSYNFQSKCYVNPSRPDPGQTQKAKLNFYFLTFLWYLKMFCEGLRDLDKTF